jgi:hypothetical protein
MHIMCDFSKLYIIEMSTANIYTYPIYIVVSARDILLGTLYTEFAHEHAYYMHIYLKLLLLF